MLPKISKDPPKVGPNDFITRVVVVQEVTEIFEEVETNDGSWNLSMAKIFDGMFTGYFAV